MKVAALQQFLQSLVPALASAGDGSASRDLAEAGQRLDPFRSLDVSDFAAFLERAEAYRASGEVAVPDPAIDRLAAALRQDGGAGQAAVADALHHFAARAGLKGKLTADPKWAEERAATERVQPHVESIRRIAAGIKSPEDYEGVRGDIDALAAMDPASLTAVAKEFGMKVTARSRADKVIVELVASLSGHAQLKPKANRVATPDADPAAIDAHAKRLAGLVERSRDPDGVSEADVKDELAVLGKLKPSALQQVVAAAGIDGVALKATKKAIQDRLVEVLTAARRARDRAEV